MEMNQSTVQISDLGLAAALVSCDFPMKGISRNESSRAFFLFIATLEIEHAVDAYWDNTLDVQAREYFDNIKMLKSRIYAEK